MDLALHEEIDELCKSLCVPESVSDLIQKNYSKRCINDIRKFIMEWNFCAEDCIRHEVGHLVMAIILGEDVENYEFKINQSHYNDIKTFNSGSCGKRTIEPPTSPIYSCLIAMAGVAADVWLNIKHGNDKKKLISSCKEYDETYTPYIKPEIKKICEKNKITFDKTFQVYNMDIDAWGYKLNGIDLSHIKEKQYGADFKNLLWSITICLIDRNQTFINQVVPYVKNKGMGDLDGSATGYELKTENLLYIKKCYQNGSTPTFIKEKG